jgi:hypothetical protein
MRTLVLCLLCALAGAQSPEAGRIVRNGDEARLIVDSPRPLDSAAITLSEQLHILVNVEAVSADMPRGEPMDVTFRTQPDGSPKDVQALLQDLLQAANARLPFSFRLDEDQGMWTFVATRALDSHGRSIEVTRLLDRHVTIALGTRSVAEHANLLAEELAHQTGLQVSCCQSVINGVPWGTETISFGANDELARSVLIRLVRATQGRYHWLMRCDASVDWCFINLESQP